MRNATWKKSISKQLDASTHCSFGHSCRRSSRKLFLIFPPPNYLFIPLNILYEMTASSASKCLFLLAVILLSSFSTLVVVGQEQQQQELQYTEADLRAMTEQQLEDICIQRGFELLKDEVDPATGEVYQLSHDDFVEAAMRCLAIEQEM